MILLNHSKLQVFNFGTFGDYGNFGNSSCSAVKCFLNLLGQC